MRILLLTLSVLLTHSFADAQDLQFGNVQLAQTETLYVQVKTTGNNYSPTVKVSGDGFDGPQSIRLEWHPDGFLHGVIHVTFTARYPGSFWGHLAIGVPSYPNSYILTATVDSAVFPSVYAEAVSYKPNDLMYPPHYCGVRTEVDRDTISFSNASFSQDSLRIWLSAIPQYFKPTIEFDTLVVAPGESKSIIIALDSEKIGKHSEMLSFASNADNYEGFQFSFRGDVLSKPRLLREPEKFVLSPKLQKYNLLVRNVGSRVLYAELPKLSSPFSWEGGERSIELCNGEETSAAILLDLTIATDTTHTYWIKTNGINFTDSARLILEARNGSLSVLPTQSESAVAMSGSEISLHEEGKVDVSSVTGMHIDSFVLKCDHSVDLRQYGAPLLFLRITTEKRTINLKVIIH
jgi:hypothetical protein